jgi:hypothetical protein
MLSRNIDKTTNRYLILSPRKSKLKILKNTRMALETSKYVSSVVSLPPESGSHNEMHNLVCGRISDEKDKGAVYAGI